MLTVLSIASSCSKGISEIMSQLHRPFRGLDLSFQPVMRGPYRTSVVTVRHGQDPGPHVHARQLDAHIDPRDSRR